MVRERERESDFSARQKPNNGKQPLQQNCSSWTVPFPLVRRTFCVSPLFGLVHGSILHPTLPLSGSAIVQLQFQNQHVKSAGNSKATQIALNRTFYSIKFSSSFLYSPILQKLNAGAHSMCVYVCVLEVDCKKCTSHAFTWTLFGLFRLYENSIAEWC